MKLLPVLLSLLVVISYMPRAHGCKCGQESNETKFCRATFALHGKILGVINAGLQVKYEVEVLHSIKSRHNKNLIIEAPRDSAACGVDLKKGADYIISGTKTRDGKYETNRCQWNELWSAIPYDTQNKLLSGRFSSCPKI